MSDEPLFNEQTVFYTGDEDLVGRVDGDYAYQFVLCDVVDNVWFDDERELWTYTVLRKSPDGDTIKTVTLDEDDLEPFANKVVGSFDEAYTKWANQAS